MLSVLHKFKLEGVFGNRILADRRHGVQIDKPEKIIILNGAPPGVATMLPGAKSNLGNQDKIYEDQSMYSIKTSGWT